MTPKSNIFFWKNILKIGQLKTEKSSKFPIALVFLNFKSLFFLSLLSWSLPKRDPSLLSEFLHKFFYFWILSHIKTFIIYLNEYRRQGCTYNKLNFFFFTYKDIFWQIEFYLIPSYFWFNFAFLIKKTSFIPYFLVLLEKISAKINRLSFTIKDNFFYFLQNSFFFLTYDEPYYTLKKLFTTLFLNKTLVVYGNEIYCSFKKTLIKMFFKNSFKKSTILFKKYDSYRAFLNTSLYLVRSFFLLNCLNTTSFNFLLLWNFNWVFFWIENPGKIFSFEELFFWTRQSFLFWNYLPYTAYNYQLKDFFLQPDHKMLFENSKFLFLEQNQKKILFTSGFFSIFLKSRTFSKFFFSWW